MIIKRTLYHFHFSCSLGGGAMAYSQSSGLHNSITTMT